MDRILQLDEKRAKYWRTRAQDLFEEMKEEVQTVLGVPFVTAVASHTDSFYQVGPRYVFNQFSKQDEFVHVLGEYDQSMIRIKTAKSQSLTPYPDDILTALF